jgi:DNA-binding transcriptional ArsR family regulator/uncharacterized protein YndB with AHSA1/START domain
VRADSLQLKGPELEDETAPLWRALADPTRRRVLDLLVERPRTTGEIAAQFTISRIAVMRHLEVLSTAGLVTSRKRGRERWHYLNAIPLRQVHERWADPLASDLAGGLLRLKDLVEAEGGGLQPTRPAVDVALEVAIAGSRAAVFAALTEDPGGWWGHPFLGRQATGLSLQPRLGGLFVEHWQDGGYLIATVTRWAQDRHLELTGPFHLGVAIGVASFDLVTADERTLVQFSFRAIGAVDAEIAERMAQGWNELIGTRLKALVESGARLGIAPDRPDVQPTRGEKRNG